MLCRASCDTIREDLPRCELWLEFAFDYNMEYADAFNPQVKSVDVFVFGSDDKLLFSKRAEATALIGGNRMSLTNELDFGNYKVLTVGSLSDNFHALDNAGRELVPGTTTLRQLTVALKRASDIVDFEFQHLYFSGVVEVDHLPSNTDHKVYRVNLIRNTNRFNIALMKLLSIARPTSRHDGTELPFQEYLDRQSEWNLIFTVTEKSGGGEFIQIGLVVGTWIYWLHGIEI